MAKNSKNLAIFECFLSICPEFLYIFYHSWYGYSPCVLLWENHSVYAGKNPNMAKIWPFVAKVFGQNWQFESLWPITLKRCYESFLFLVWNIFLWSPLRKSYSICRENSYMAKLWPFKPFLAEIDSFESFVL